SGNGLGRHEIDYSACQAALRRATAIPAGAPTQGPFRRDRAGIRRVFPGGHVRRGREVRQDEAPVSPVSHHPNRSSRGLPPRRPAAVNGFVDNQLRALLRVSVSASRDGERTDLQAWIDTAFNGGLAIPRKQATELGLTKQSSAEAVLADGRTVELETFA